MFWGPRKAFRGHGRARRKTQQGLSTATMSYSAAAAERKTKARAAMAQGIADAKAGGRRRSDPERAAVTFFDRNADSDADAAAPEPLPEPPAELKAMVAGAAGRKADARAALAQRLAAAPSGSWPADACPPSVGSYNVPGETVALKPGTTHRQLTAGESYRVIGYSPNEAGKLMLKLPGGNGAVAPQAHLGPAPGSGEPRLPAPAFQRGASARRAKSKSESEKPDARLSGSSFAGVCACTWLATVPPRVAANSLPRGWGKRGAQHNAAADMIMSARRRFRLGHCHQAGSRK